MSPSLLLGIEASDGVLLTNIPSYPVFSVCKVSGDFSRLGWVLREFNLSFVPL